MFIGHFAVGLAAKKASPKINLGILFIACQLLDLIWPVLVLIGLEKSLLIIQLPLLLLLIFHIILILIAYFRPFYIA